MPLITSTTVLNKIKWGRDRVDYGSSNQPYIQRDIPGVDVDNPNPTIVNDDASTNTFLNGGGMDFLLRGGIGAPIDAARDVSRLTQMFFDTKSPNGFEFIAKYNLLSRTAVKTEASYGIGYGGATPPDFVNGSGGGAVNAGIYTPLSTLGQAAVGFTGTHLNALGLDPSDPMTGVLSGGLFPGAGLRTYLSTVGEKNSANRFSEKIEKFTEKEYNVDFLVTQIGISNGSLPASTALPPEYIDVEKERFVVDPMEFENRLVNLKDYHQSISSPTILSYSGGPGSIVGIGSTDIMFATDQVGNPLRTGFNNELYVTDESYFLGGVGNKNKYERSPETKIYGPKLGASKAYAQIFPDASASIADDTNDTTLQNVNATPSAIKPAILDTGDYKGFFDPTGSDNYSVFKNTSEYAVSGTLDFSNKLGASSASAATFEDISASLAEDTNDNSLQNVNTVQSAIENTELTTGQYAGFIQPTGSNNNYSVFKNTSDGVTEGEINYERVELPLLQSLSASNSTIMPDEASMIEAQDTGSIQNQNTPQSTFRNAKIDAPESGESFFNPDGPNNYKIFGTKDVTLDKSSIFVSGSSVSYAFSDLFPSSAATIFEGLVLNAPGGLELFNNNVYEPGTLTTDPREAGGSARSQGTLTFTQEQIELRESYVTNPQITDFRKTIIESQEIEEISNVLSLAPSYVNKAANRRVNRGDPGASNTSFGAKNVFNYGIPATEMQALDKINALPMYEAGGPDGSKAINDFCRFSIAAINNDKPGNSVYMHFRAFIDSFNDNYNSTWDPVQYAGRGDTLYNYSGFNRGINMSFTCFAQSKAELIPMYKKLNYLASTLAPDYTEAGFMRGNLIKLTMGGYLREQPGFITSLTYDIPQEAPWEIAIDAVGGGDGSVKELPHMIKVSNLAFTPIQNFLPQKPNNAKSPNERFISLSTSEFGKGNYADQYRTQLATGDGDEDASNDISGAS